MPKFRAGDIVVNRHFSSYYKIYTINAELYYMTSIEYNKKTGKIKRIGDSIAVPISLGDFVLELVESKTFFYNQLWGKINV